MPTTRALQTSAPVEPQLYGEDDKHSIHHVDKDLDNDGVDRHLAVRVPEILLNLSPEELAAADRSATRKLDMLLMPTLILLYLLNYLDRQNISSAKIAGIATDLGLTADQYSTSVAILFAGYVSLQIPSNIIASKIKYPATYICLMCAVWGLISGCTAAVQNYPGLTVCRCFLGFAEAAFYPGAIFLLSTFYEKKKIGMRSAALYLGSQSGNAFGGLFALGVIQLDGRLGIPGWRWLYIVEGSITVFLAIIIACIIPNKPETMRWLTDVERAQLVHRLQIDRATVDATDETTIRQAFVLAVTDPKTWLLCGVEQMICIAASVTNFFPIVVKGLGFNTTITLVISAPPYLLCCVFMIINGWHSDKKQERTLHIIIPFCVTIIGNVIALSTTNVAARYFAMCILPPSFYGAFVIVISWISSSMTGPHIKRAIVFALINCLCNTPNIWTSYLYGNNGPRYIAAFSVDLAAAVGCVLFAAGTHLYLRRQNAKLDRGESLGQSGPTQIQIEGGFRYQL
ncbi:putative nicotinamide mononucleotide permease [Naematelia encephala]|uniref:Putative nicotinamide mononucleotide permease n=1 Tax=Naematelia encephala TaxID=71784 RepID=A0A1Y2B7T8_9TREE|nr:putative nicotinamide mononucleotide permease [Naematelia encephala]